MFIARPSKENGLLLLKDLNSLMAFREGFLKAREGRGSQGTQSAHGHCSDWWMVRSLGISIINLLVLTDLESMCWWAAYSSFLPPGGGFKGKTAPRTWLRIRSTVLEEELKVLDFV